MYAKPMNIKKKVTWRKNMDICAKPTRKGSGRRSLVMECWLVISSIFQALHVCQANKKGGGGKGRAAIRLRNAAVRSDRFPKRGICYKPAREVG